MSNIVTIGPMVYFEAIRLGYIDTGDTLVFNGVLYHLMTAPNDNN